MCSGCCFRSTSRPLEGLAALDRLLAEDAPARTEAATRDLCETVLELADALNRLTGNAHAGLYARLSALERDAAEALARLNRTRRRVWIGLEEITAGLREEAGGKAQPLGALLAAGFPVPEGVAVLRRSCRNYLRQARLEERLEAILARAASPDEDLEALALAARNMILASGPDPEFEARLREAWDHLARGGALAVSARSSASGEDSLERSFAGQYVSVLGITRPEGLVPAFKEVLAGAFSARALAYRSGAGVSGRSLDMAVLIQRMVPARVSGVLFTRDPMRPEEGRMLLTAVPGLGTQAVSGRSPSDLYRPLRDPAGEPPEATPAEIAVKSVAERMAPEGGLVLESWSGPEAREPLLDAQRIAELRLLGLRIEALAGAPQDIEWSLDQDGRLWVLQSRPARMARAGEDRAASSGRVLLEGGLTASPGKAAGVLALARSREDLAGVRRMEGPVILALRQSLVDAAALLPNLAGLLVDLGNPLDHLACLARELGRPMITGLGSATARLTPGQWVLADADRGRVLAADPTVWQGAPRPRERLAETRPDAASDLRRLILSLNLTDAYGPAFSILECRSLHDLVRFIHEKAVLAMFEAGDTAADEAFPLVRRLKDQAGLKFLIIDLGGGLAGGGDGGASASIDLDQVRCEPLLALCRGMSVPGLRWNAPPPGASLSGLLSRSLLDQAGARPLGNPNYALAARDYLNLNARVDFHFVMIDAVCGNNPRANSIRFRFKGGGTAQVQRERRVRFIEEVLKESGFFTNRQGDMVTGLLGEAARETIVACMEMLGRLLGFSRLLDAAMVHEDMPGRVARAFLAGDYALEGLDLSVPEDSEADKA